MWRASPHRDASWQEATSLSCGGPAPLGGTQVGAEHRAKLEDGSWNPKYHDDLYALTDEAIYGELTASLGQLYGLVSKARHGHKSEYSRFPAAFTCCADEHVAI